MIEPWELILHHTYSGTPGVAFDSSPKRGSHGTAVGLQPSDFVLDGYARESGAVRFRRHGTINVTPTHGWDHLGGVRAEVTFRRDPQGGGGHLINGRPQSFYIIVGDREMAAAFKTDDHFPGSLLGEQDFAVSYEEAGVDPLAWITFGVVHDGCGTVQISVNGHTVKTWQDTPLQRVRPMSTITIGNDPGGGLPLPGLIDEVKVWRPNPNKISNDFTGRIIDAGLTDCWARWGKGFRDALDDLAKSDSECLGRLAQLFDDALVGVLTPALTHSPETRRTFEQAVTSYRSLWAAGHVADIRPVLKGLRDALAAAGIDIEQGDAFRTLVNDQCFRELMRSTPALDCDPEFTRMLSGGEG